ncbi:phosphatase PAP2 family protein [Falsibacillus pallidus]|uniref:Undecaprenyl-diphosphatase n=1 Tax=Falsibacillus pallidus TaxID=493781 RepID=A0A370GIT2_9BACI|nr:phosphatase PAP2 family protein [Falsibacillus pallidus]RDI43136.1 undecaprenyl-diphosphatase [Falsibacillus pallidus]
MKIGIIAALIIIFTKSFLEIADDYNESEIRHFDSFVIAGVQGHVSPFWTKVMVSISFLGSVRWIMILSIATALILFLFKHRLLCLYVIFTVSLGGAFNWILKSIFQRQRPDIEPIIEEQGYSFPSGHSMGSFIFYGALAFIIFKLYEHRLAKAAGVLLVSLLVLAIGISRIYLGVHYPSDIVGGYTAGAAWTFICITGYSFLDFRLKKRLE